MKYSPWRAHVVTACLKRVTQCSPTEVEKRSSLQRLLEAECVHHSTGISDAAWFPNIPLHAHSSWGTSSVLDLQHPSAVVAIALLCATTVQGSSVGHSFEQLRYMIDRVEDQSRVGVCLDTCHMFAAGYDLTTPAAYAATMQHFDDVVGLRFLKGMLPGKCRMAYDSPCPLS